MEETRSFEFVVPTLERQSQGRLFGLLGERETWVLKRQRQQGKGIIEELGKDVTLELMEIPGGTFVMGSPQEELERFERESPQHEVSVPGFYMGRYPITQAQWQVVALWEPVERELDANPAYFKEKDSTSTRPVEQVSWYDAKEFCARLNRKTKRDYRLPTEAEWEYSCRAVIREQSSAPSEQLTVEEWNEKYHQPFHCGETISTKLANYNGNYTYGRGVKGESRGETTPVGYFQFANAFGLYDMHGNVFEWCEDDYHDSYEGAPKDGSAWLSGKDDATKVLRGSAWGSNPFVCRSAFRVNQLPNYRYYSLGLRLVRV